MLYHQDLEERDVVAKNAVLYLLEKIAGRQQNVFFIISEMFIVATIFMSATSVNYSITTIPVYMIQYRHLSYQTRARSEQS
jgi:predicted HAD superfamily hydrolase